MDIEIRRNTAIRFSFTTKAPDNFREWWEKHTSHLKGRNKELVEKSQKELSDFEESVWKYLEQNPHDDLDGNRITKETHEIGYEKELIEEKEGLRFEKITKVYIMPR